MRDIGQPTAPPFARPRAVQEFSGELSRIQAMSLRTFRAIGSNPNPHDFMSHRRGANEALLNYLRAAVPNYPRMEDDDPTLLEVEANMDLADRSNANAVQKMAIDALVRVQTLIQTTAGDRYRSLLQVRGART